MKKDDLLKRYPYIWAWGRMMGSHDYYIQSQMEAAQKDGAPHDTIYHRDDFSEKRVWVTYSNISSLDTKRSIWKVVQSNFDENLPEPTWKDTFQPVSVVIGNIAVLSIQSMNNNNPSDVRTVYDAIEEFVKIRFPEEPPPGSKTDTKKGG